MIIMDYPIVAMIGSSRFKQEYHDEGKRLTLEGNLVIPLCLYRVFLRIRSYLGKYVIRRLDYVIKYL